MTDIKASLPEWLKELTKILQPNCKELYLVGGVLRNLMLGKSVEDYDFVVPQNAIECAKKASDILSGKFYILDNERKTARALIPIDSLIIKLDFALIIGNSIFDDLKARDFTINALALRLPHDDSVIDPTGGLDDLRKRRLRPCSSTSFIDDPVRIIRYVRFVEEFDLDFEPKTFKMAQEASWLLDNVSGERQRDSLLQMISVSNVKSAFDLLLEIGCVPYLFAGLDKLNKVELSLPHTYNVWDHTMQVMHYCQQMMAGMELTQSICPVHPRIKQAIAQLKPYQSSIQAFFLDSVSTGRTKYQLLILAALFHDAAKGVVAYQFKEERRKYPGHAKVGAGLIRRWAKDKGFSKKEAAYLYNTILMHMKVSSPKMIKAETKRLFVHRFFKRAGEAGILTAVLHLADVLTTYEAAITDVRWDQALTVVENILNAYFFHYDEIIKPPLLLNGRDVMLQLEIDPGKKVGYLLNKLEEAQVLGLVTDRQSALKYLLSRKDSQN